LFNSFFF